MGKKYENTAKNLAWLLLESAPVAIPVAVTAYSLVAVILLLGGYFNE